MPIGNVVGTLIASACLQYGWGWSFAVPGLLMSVMGLVVYCLLVVEPGEVGLCGADVADYRALVAGGAGGDEEVRLVGGLVGSGVGVWGWVDLQAVDCC